jgi:hypothetical protein
MNGGVAKPIAYWEAIQERINTAQAVDVINNVVAGDLYRGKQIGQLQATMAWNLINKLIPSRAAIAVEVSHRQATSLLDLKTRADLLGIDESLLLGQPIDNTHVIDSVSEEKSIVPDDSIEAPLPPD